MTEATLSYHTEPIKARKPTIKPSADFKKSINEMILVVLGFALVYFLLLLLVIGIALLWVWLGMVLIKSHIGPMPVLGIVFIPSGLLLIFFLIKFIFVARPEEQHEGFEIKKNDQPQLFEFLETVAKETGARAPKHLYLTDNVNAAASVKLSFFNLFFPTRKNLTLGLGLINVINISEFKAVLAHEFGHFSQRSMRLDLYVLGLNKALYNMLYENSSYANLVNSWGRLHWLLSFPVVLNALIIKGIQRILRRFYSLINKQRMKLSRESEFHADAIASSIAGASNVESLLGRYQIGGSIYGSTIELVNTLALENKRSPNIYQLHRKVLLRFAHIHNLCLDASGLPIQDSERVALSEGRISFDDPWASHPTLGDRFKRLRTYTEDSKNTVHMSAWVLFRDPEHLQRIFTDNIYVSIGSEESIKIVTNNELEEVLQKELTENAFNELYKGYYDNRFIATFDIEETIALIDQPDSMQFQELFNSENGKLSQNIEVLQVDMNRLLTIINDGGTHIKSFDFDGERQDYETARTIFDEFQLEFTAKQERLDALDQKAFKMFYESATSSQKTLLVQHYENVFKYQSESTKDYLNYSDLKNKMSSIRAGRLTYKEIYKIMDDIYIQERRIKPRIRQVMNEPGVNDFINEAQREVLEKYLNTNLIYFLEPNYNVEALSLFHKALNTYAGIISKKNFKIKKDLLDFQLTLNYPN